MRHVAAHMLIAHARGQVNPSAVRRYVPELDTITATDLADLAALADTCRGDHLAPAVDRALELIDKTRKGDE